MALLNDILAGMNTAAAASQVVLRLVSMMGQGGNACASEIENIVCHDEMLSMTILRYGNSARHGRPGSSFTVKESIVRLGNSELLRIVLKQKTADIFNGAGAAYDLHRGALWRSAVGGAIAAESLARRTNFESPDMAFLCGLVRDIGKVAFDHHFGPQYISHVAPHMSADRTFDDAERLAFGFDHAELGAALAIEWNLPARIADAIRHHHDPPAPGDAHDVLFDLVHAADIISLWAGLAIGYDGMQYRLAEHVRESLHLNRPLAERLIAHSWEKLRESESLMDQSKQERASA